MKNKARNLSHAANTNTGILPNSLVEKYVYRLSRQKKRILPLFALLIIIMVVGAFKITLNLNPDAFFQKSDTHLQQFRKYQYVFGSDDVIISTIKGDVFSNEYLNKIDALQKEIEAEVPYIDNTTSIINVSQLYTEGDTLYVDDLLANFPETQLTEEELKRLKNTVINDPVFKNRVVSSDGNYSTIIVEFLSPKEIEEAKIQDEKSIVGESGFANDEPVGEDDGLSFDDLENLFDDTEVGDGPIDSIEQAYVDDEATDVYLSIEQAWQVFKATQSIREKFESDDFEIAMVGNPLMIPALIYYLLGDLVIFFPILIIFVLIFTFIMFRRISAILLCVSVAGITNVFVIGSMGWTGVPLTILTNIVPLILFTMSLGAVIHLLTLVYRKFDEGHTKEGALIYALSHSGLPIALTTLTSAAGIFSFFFSTIKPMKDFAVFGAFGLTISFVLTLVFVPLLILTLPIKRVSLKTEQETDLTKVDAIFKKLSSFSYNYRWISFVVTIVIVGVALLGIQKVYFSHRPNAWLPDSAVFKQDTIEVDKVMNGSNQMAIYIDTKENGGVLEPEFLRKLEIYEEKMSAYNEANLKIGNVISFVTIVKKIHEALDGVYEIPNSKELVAQEVLLLENGGTDALTSLVDLNYRYTTITLTAPDLDAVYFSKHLLKYSHAVLDELFKGDDYEYYETGGIALLARTITASIESTVRSYVIAFIVITFLMIFLTKHILVGLLSMIPNILPLFFLLGIIGFTPINLDMFVLLIGSVLMGFAVDNTIHFIHVFRSHIADGETTQEAITHTFLSTGKAMTTASVVLAGGFAVFIFARMNNFNSFGIMATIGIAVALFSDFFLTPAIMSYVIKEKKQDQIE